MEVISYLNLGENLSQNMRAGLCAQAAEVWPTSHPAEPWVSKLWDTLGCRVPPALLTKGLASSALGWQKPAQMPPWGHDLELIFLVWVCETDGVWSIPGTSCPSQSGCRRDGSPGSWGWVPAVAPGYWPQAICIISQFSKSLDWVWRQEIFSILLELQIVCYGFYKALKRLCFQPICYSGYILSHFFIENYLLPAKYSMLMTY